MKYRQNVSTGIVTGILCIIFVALPAYGYIDANAGLVSQGLTPLLVAAGVGLTVFRKQGGEAFSALSQRRRDNGERV
jgi:hypothetical protein